ncbi:MAG: threonyl-tRNA synthetase editing domain-containing protein [Myxococcota bacterium]|nr:threonyl-tRNA synthetase editing domain-containing protein [Myxococcota bacterium]
MKLLTWQAERFAWRSFSKTLEDQPDQDVDVTVEAAVVVFMQVEACDQEPEARKRAFKHTLKHLKWLANKRDLRRVVLHSFAHLGGQNAEAGFAKTFLDDLDQRLTDTGYEVHQTPFGYFCEWDLSVYGDSLAKVWKEIGPAD